MIAHIDADSFFASVLQRKYPRLRGKPLLALGMGGGCVIAASYEAKAKGIKTGMRFKDAITLCPNAVSMPSDFAETAIASHEIEAVLQDHSPVIEQMSIDEWFIDLHTLVGGVPFDLLLWAADLQKEIQKMTGLWVSVGVAPSKLLAKMASEYKKPRGVTIVEKHKLEQFLSDRPAAAISGIGRARQRHTDAHHWNTAWDFAMADREKVSKLFGKNGHEMQRELLGERVSPVAQNDSPPKSISRCRSFRATRKRDDVWAHLLQHVNYTILKMRKQKLAARGITVWLRDGTYKHDGLQLRLPQPFDTEESITPYVRRCFDRVYSPRTPYTQVGFALWDLHDKAAQQFSLFSDPQNIIRADNVQASLDILRVKYGREVVVSGSALSVMKKRDTHLDLSVFN